MFRIERGINIRLIKRVGLALFFITFTLSSYCYACVGARPMAMGGAFTGVADDVTATYWNPAGLTQIEGAEATYTGTLYNRDEINYDDFLSYALPLYLKNYDIDLGTFGAGFINSGFDVSVAGLGIETIDRWYWLSYGKKLPFNLSLGLNTRWQVSKLGFSMGGAEIKDEDNTFGLDLGLFWRWAIFSAGLLVQDINEPEVTLFGEKAKFIRNVRPGFAIRPDDRTILSFELYDATGESDAVKQNIRLGAERYFDLPWEGASFALRCGAYDINADDEANRALTGGLGYKWRMNGLTGDPRDPLLELSIDYALLCWYDAPSSADAATHFLGFKVSVPWGESEPQLTRKEESIKEPFIVQEYPSQHNIKVTQRLPQKKTLAPEPLDRQAYFNLVKEKISQNLELSTKSRQRGIVNVSFDITSVGGVKNVLISGTEDVLLKEEIRSALKNISFPAFPQDMQEQEKMRFNFKIQILPSA